MICLQKMQRTPLRVSAALLCAAFLAALLLGVEAPAVSPIPPRLVVVISLDQFRGDYLDEFDPCFGDDGFRRLRAGGVEFTDCNYRQAGTKTAVGHAIIATGNYPNVNGIVGNEWMDPETFEWIVAVQDPASPIVGSRVAVPSSKGRSPRNLIGDTTADLLKKSTAGRARVVTVAGKDRTAILLGGRHPDGAYWLSGRDFVTAAYCRDSLPDWVVRFNAEDRVTAAFGSTWDRLLPEEAYARLGPDDAPGEESRQGLGRTLPKRIDGGWPRPSPDFESAFGTSPFHSELLVEFAKRAIVEEQLGVDSVTDLLCIGISQTDSAGHAYGPDSHEMLDSVARLDRTLGGFLKFLDAQVGLDACLIVVVSDHGVAPLPEHMAATEPGTPAGRVNGSEIDNRVQRALEEKYGPPPQGQFWSIRDGSGIRFNMVALRARSVSVEAASAVAKAALLSHPQIGWAYTAAELAGPEPLDPVGEATRLSYFPVRAPEVAYVPRPFFVEKSDSGTTHGTPHRYDTHVPLIFFGAGLKHAVHGERAGMESMAPTLARLIGLPGDSSASLF